MEEILTSLETAGATIGLDCYCDNSTAGSGGIACQKLWEDAGWRRKYMCRGRFVLSTDEDARFSANFGGALTGALPARR